MIVLSKLLSSEKRKKDTLSREQKLQKAESELFNLALKLNKRKLKTKEEIEKRIEQILKHYMDVFSLLKR